LKGWFRSAKALQGLGKLELAAQAATKAQQLEPGNKDVSEVREHVWWLLCCLPPSEILTGKAVCLRWSRLCSNQDWVQFEWASRHCD
jgi:hypothetical protein